MRRREAVAALVAGTMIVLAVMAVFAVELAQNQSQSKSTLETQARQRAVLVSGLIDAVFQAISQPSAATVAAYGTPKVADATLERSKGANQYVLLLDANGNVLAHTTGLTAQAKATLTGPGAVAQVRAGQSWALGNLRPYGSSGVINFATRLQTPSGTRILVTGFRPSSLSPFLTKELTKVPGVQGHHQVLVDGNGVVLASTNPQRPAGYVFHTAGQLKALREPAGETAGRYFDHVAMANTSWTLFVSAPSGQFFASVSGARHWVPWLIFIAFGLVAVATLLLARRALRDSDRVAVANGQLTSANVQLAAAKSSLEESNSALAESNSALEVTNVELERRARELGRSNAELDQFASIASHDLQEPLRKVRTFTERIREAEGDNLSERGLDYLQRANASAERMQRLIEDLLRYSRVGSQGSPFRPVNLAQVTADVLEDLDDQITRSGAIVNVGPLPTISADPPQMRQLMQNLISNALKFRREGVTPEVEVESKVDSGWVAISVRDNGIGFDPQYSRRIFRVFERLHGRGTYAGTGIGLALCRKIAERHGGTVDAHSVPDEGSIFTVMMQTQRTGAVSDVPLVDETEQAHATEQEPYVAA